ncbi:MAG: chemotaxis response regulator protein-glutamate methylesterase, partial [Planctomycetes bacterium]|nr:chemotaxis response regulator protein-glutamate methylesterase [Planctomycetota bacterium]
ELPVIVFSSHTERGAAMTLRSLAAGADDYLAKPAELADSEAIRRELRDGIISRIDALVRRNAPAALPSLPSETYRAIASKRNTSPIDLVVIGASTGGPDALGTVLQGLPADLPVPVLVVVHILPMFSRLLAEQLDAKCPLEIREGISGGHVEPGVVWLAPGAKHMFVEKGEGGLTVALNRSAPVHGCRPAVDVLFESVAKTTGAGVLGVILTGMGEDGCTGAAAIRAQGGQILAQDEATSVVYGMPRAVVEAGIADEVLPLQEIAGVIERRVRKTRVRV